ncbi:MAG: L,D-transpeptidase [Pelosinus sp.]|nr:L,D-transpeptidase [Pelosinus sp.]
MKLTYNYSTGSVSTNITLQGAKKRNNLALPRASILITKSTRQLTLLDGNTSLRSYPVGIGKIGTPTPVGNFAIAAKVMNPGGVLGTRWMGLNYDSYGIHGTNAPWLIGQMVSHGCIRMHNSNAEELFALVNVGTPVYIRD